MSGILFLVSLTLFWLALHASRRVFSSRSSQYTILPRSRKPLTQSWLDKTQTTLTLSYVNFKAETYAFNGRHDRLISSFSRSRWKATATKVYDVGVFAGLIGAVASVGLLLWTGLFLIWESLPEGHGASPLLKRALGVALLEQRSESNVALRPLIPGVTVPLSHLPVMLLLLFVSQSFHEFGHALTAVMEDVHLSSIGVALHLLIPTAFVALRYSASTTPRSQLRMACAGPWHNVILWLAVFLVSKSGIGQVARRIGWTDVSGLGKVVEGFNENSGLVDFVPLGALITQLDDTSLGLASQSQRNDPWDRFLLDDIDQDEGSRGWCLDQSWFDTQPTECCLAKSSSDLSCFVPSSQKAFPDTPAGRCVSALTLFNRFSARCAATSRSNTQERCSDGQICVIPASDAHLLRITLVDMARGKEKVVIWKGPRREVWRQLQVGTDLPRWSWVPLWLPSLVSLFINYTLTINTALYLFNLLPLPYLDGGQVLSSVLDILMKPERDERVDDPEAATDQPRTRVSWRQRLESLITWAVGGLAAVVGLAVVLKELTMR